MGAPHQDPGVNHCLLEVEVLEAPQIRYTQDNQTPVAEMTVRFDGLRVDDPPGQIRAVGWGSVAQDLQNRVAVGQRLLLEGRFRMNTVTRTDGSKEKRAELTLSRFHPLAGEGVPTGGTVSQPPAPAAVPRASSAAAAPVRRGAGAPSPRPSAPPPAAEEAAAPVWNASPLVPDPDGLGDQLDDDDIPF